MYQGCLYNHDILTTTHKPNRVVSSVDGVEIKKELCTLAERRHLRSETDFLATHQPKVVVSRPDLDQKSKHHLAIITSTRLRVGRVDVPSTYLEGIGLPRPLPATVGISETSGCFPRVRCHRDAMLQGFGRYK